MTFTPKKNNIPFTYHLLFWLCYFTFNVIRWGSYFDNYWYSLKSNLIEFPLHLLIVYFNIYYLVPKFIAAKKYKSYIGYLGISLALLYVVRTSLIYILVTKNIWPEAETSQQAFTFNHIVAVVLGEIYVVSLVTLIKLTIDWVYVRKRVEDLKAIQLATELQFLKAQIQPHFFFNTLNNLYALSLEKSEKAPDVILKLSEIMEHVLYGVKKPKIRLFDEIKYIQNYIDLEKLRYGDKVQVEINLQGNIENISVPPLLFLPFIENCFKHGAIDNTNFKIFINFKNIDKNKLIFTVSNNYNYYQYNNTVKRHGIGNTNVRRRLELLFKDNFSLIAKVEKESYTVELIIPL